MIDNSDITAVILAGGRGRRMQGEDKGLLELSGRPLIEHIIAGLAPQLPSILINANRNRDRYGSYGYPVVGDNFNDFQGPLAGFAAAMEALETPYMLTLPCDAPQVLRTLVPRLCQALEAQDAEIAVAHDGRRMQPVYALIPVALLPSLQRFLAAGDRKIDLWYARHRVALADFSDQADAFRNINTPEERSSMETERNSR